MGIFFFLFNIVLHISRIHEIFKNKKIGEPKINEINFRIIFILSLSKSENLVACALKILNNDPSTMTVGEVTNQTIIMLRKKKFCNLQNSSRVIKNIIILTNNQSKFSLIVIKNT